MSEINLGHVVATVNGYNVTQIIPGANIELYQENNVLVISTTGGSDPDSTSYIDCSYDGESVTQDLIISSPNQFSYFVGYFKVKSRLPNIIVRASQNGITNCINEIKINKASIVKDNDDNVIAFTLIGESMDTTNISIVSSVFSFQITESEQLGYLNTCKINNNMMLYSETEPTDENTKIWVEI